MRRVLFLLVVCFFFPWSTNDSLAYGQESPQSRIVSNVELVQIPVIVFDNKGRIASDLKKSDFRLFDNGVEQEILYFEQERVPVSFVILADVSSSMTHKIPFVQQAALSLVDTPQGEDASCDEYSLLTIGTRSQLVMPFTCDQQDLDRRLPLLLTPTNESTALFDTIWQGVTAAERDAANQHRAMIIITDGGDNHSRYNVRETKAMLEEADLPVFAVMAGPSFELPQFLLPKEKKPSARPFPNPFPVGMPRPKLPDIPFPHKDEDYIGPAEMHGPENMKVLTEASGGGVFTARHESDLPRIVHAIGLAVRYRYVLTYKPTHDQISKVKQSEPAADANLHKIHLELYPKAKFVGYSVPYYKGTYHSSR